MLLEDKGDPEYLEKEARYKKVVTRFRLGSKSMCNKYWKGEEEKTCRLCKKTKNAREYFRRMRIYKRKQKNDRKGLAD